MTQEEKAKAYDEAKARMSRAYNSNRCTIGFMNEIFPELKESEDERIMRFIVSGMTALKEQGKETFATIPINDCIAWLKEQGEKSTDEMIETLRTEYEKGRADVLNKIDSEQLESFIELCNDLQMRSTNESLYDELEKLKNWIKSL